MIMREVDLFAGPDFLLDFVVYINVVELDLIFTTGRFKQNVALRIKEGAVFFRGFSYAVLILQLLFCWFEAGPGRFFFGLFLQFLEVLFLGLFFLNKLVVVLLEFRVVIHPSFVVFLIPGVIHAGN